jgi:hypothetical protein
MPSNGITINGQENLRWEVPDSKMSLLVSVLATLGEPQSDEARELQQQELTSPGFDLPDKAPLTMRLWDPDTQVLVAKVQNGPVKEHGKNGVQIDSVIDCVSGILMDFDKRVPSSLTKVAILCLQAALEALAARTAERTGRGVEGTEQP